MIARAAALVALALMLGAPAVAANPAAPPDWPAELVLAGANASRALVPGEVAWLVASPGDAGAATVCEGCAIELLACNTVCTYRLTARDRAWRASVGPLSLAQGARAYLSEVHHGQ
jgi:hypothetical protein